VLPLVGGIHLGLQVIAGCGGTQPQVGDILLDAGLQLVDAFGGMAGAEQQHACRQRVKRASVAHLHLTGLQVGAQYGTNLLDRCKGGHPQRLVNAEYFAFYRVKHYLYRYKISPGGIFKRC